MIHITVTSVISPSAMYGWKCAIGTAATYSRRLTRCLRWVAVSSQRRFPVLPQQSLDRNPKQEEAEPCEYHRGGVERDRERVRTLFDDVGGEEGQQRRGEEIREIGVEDAMIALLHRRIS